MTTHNHHLEFESNNTSSRRVSLDVSNCNNNNNNNMNRAPTTIVPTMTTSMDPSATTMIMMPTGTTAMPPATASSSSCSQWQPQQQTMNDMNAMGFGSQQPCGMNLSNNAMDNNNSSNHSMASGAPVDMMEPILPIPPVSFFPGGGGGAQMQQHRRASAPGFFGNNNNPMNNNNNNMNDSAFSRLTQKQQPNLHHHRARKLSLPFASNTNMMMNNNNTMAASSFLGTNNGIVSSSFHGCLPTPQQGGVASSDMDDSNHSQGTQYMGNTSIHSRSSSRRVSVGGPPPYPNPQGSNSHRNHHNNNTRFGSAGPKRPRRTSPVTTTTALVTPPTVKAMRPRPPGMLSFPTKLHQILDHPDYQEYIRWMPHGRSWRILKAKAFEVNVLPKHFRSARYASFMRQVNGWGFRRMTEGPDLNAYFHPCFVKGMPELCEDMRRPQKGQNPLEWAEDYPDKNPDFYKIQAIIPLPSRTRVEATTDDKNDTSEEEGEGQQRNKRTKLLKSPPSTSKNTQEVMGEVSESSTGSGSGDDEEADTEALERRKKIKNDNTEVETSTKEPQEPEPEEEPQTNNEEDDLPMMPPHRSSFLDLDDNTVASWGDDFSEAQVADDETVRQDVFSTLSPPRKIRIGRRFEEASSSSITATPPPPSSISTSASSSRGASPTTTTNHNNKNHLIAPSLSEEETPSLASSSSSSGGVLSKADLSYLAYQNKLLLRQTQLLQRQKERQQKQRTTSAK